MGGALRDDPGDRVKKGFTRVNKWKNCDETQERKEKNEKTIGENRKGANFDERVLKDQGYGIPGGGDEVNSHVFYRK